MKNTKHDRVLLQHWDIIFTVLIIGIVLFSYRGLSKTFFEQDEWGSMGQVLARGPLAVLSDYSFVGMVAGQARPLGTFINNLFYYFFPFNALPFVLFAITIQTINSVLVYFVAKKISKSFVVAAIAGTFFAVAHLPDQAIIWFAVNTTALPNATFLLISLLLYLRYIDASKNSFLYGSYLCAAISYLFKESSLYFFFLLPFVGLFYGNKKFRIKTVFQESLPIIIYVLFVLGVRVLSLTGVEGKQGVFVTNGEHPMVKVIFHMLFYPLTGLSQMFIPPPMMFKVADVFQQLNYAFLLKDPMGLAILQIVTSAILSLYGTMILLGICLITWVFFKPMRKALAFALLFSLLSFLPFAVLDNAGSAYLEPRYYYNPMIGGALLLGILVSFIPHIFLRWKVGKNIYSVIWCLTLAIYSFFLYKSIVFIERDVRYEQIVSEERITLVDSFKKLRPHLPINPIVYVWGDSPGFYAVPNLVLPLQQGIGYTLMVLYAKTGVVPKELLASSYLWNINAQGYKEVNGQGFGYFWDKDALKKYVSDHPSVTNDQIVGFYYMESQKKLIDITDKTRVFVRSVDPASSIYP